MHPVLQREEHQQAASDTSKPPLPWPSVAALAVAALAAATLAACH